MTHPWPEVPLGEVADLQDGPFGSNLRSADYVEDGVRVVRLQNIGRRVFLDRDRAYISEDHFRRLGKHACEPGDVLIATLGDPIVRACQLPDWVPFALNKADCVRARGRSDAIDPGYLIHWLNSPMFLGRATSMSHGQTRPRVNLSQLRESALPLPSIEEQLRIVAVLDAADEARAKRWESVRQIGSLTEAIFEDKFGSVMDVERRPLGDLLSFLTSGSRGWARYYADNGDRFIRIQNVLRDALDLTDSCFVHAPDNAEARRTRVRKGDVLMSITADLGRTAVVGPEADGAYINQHLCLMRSDALEPRFLSAFLCTSDAVRQIQRRNRGGVKAGLNFDDVRSIEVPVPPRCDQARFAGAAASVDEMRATQATAFDHLDEMFGALQQRAFRGEL